MICCMICGAIFNGDITKTCREEMTARNLDPKHLIGDVLHIWHEQREPGTFYGKSVVNMLNEDLDTAMRGKNG